MACGDSCKLLYHVLLYTYRIVIPTNHMYMRQILLTVRLRAPVLSHRALDQISQWVSRARVSRYRIEAYMYRDHSYSTTV